MEAKTDVNLAYEYSAAIRKFDKLNRYYSF